MTSAIGTFAGRRLADRNASGTLLVGNVVLVLALGGLYLSGPHPLLVAVALAAWGLVGMGITPSLQLRVISLAGEGGDLAATLGASAVNAGIASGAAIGAGTVAAYASSTCRWPLWWFLPSRSPRPGPPAGCGCPPRWSGATRPLPGTS